MSILVNKNTKVITQGITGSAGAFHTKGCLDYGTKMVGGVTPGKGGQKDPNGLPIFNTVDEAVKATGADATMIFVPPGGAGDAVLEAAAAGIRLVCCITDCQSASRKIVPHAAGQRMIPVGMPRCGVRARAKSRAQ